MWRVGQQENLLACIQHFHKNFPTVVGEGNFTGQTADGYAVPLYARFVSIQQQLAGAEVVALVNDNGLAPELTATFVVNLADRQHRTATGCPQG